MEVCTVKSCGRVILAKGLCQPHYDRLRRYGTLQLRPAVLNCADCGVEFDPGTRGAVREVCRECADERHRTRVRSQRWQKGLREKYSMTVEEYHELLEAQGGVCAICGTEQTTGRGSENNHFSVDHDHKTGAVRGLLCHACNTAIGLLQDSPTLLHSAIKYLEANNG